MRSGGRVGFGVGGLPAQEAVSAVVRLRPGSHVSRVAYSGLGGQGKEVAVVAVGPGCSVVVVVRHRYTRAEARGAPSRWPCWRQGASVA